jgi:two-component system, NarL family, nitrate/nitrite response regulator NarL
VFRKPQRTSPWRLLLVVSQQAKLIRLIIAGEHSIFRHGLRRLLESEPGLCILHEIADGAAAVALVGELAPDILLLGLAHSKRPSIETLKSLAGLSIPTRTILLTDRLDRTEVLHAVQLGVAGVVLKDSPPEVLFKSIRTVMAGEYWLGHERFPIVVSNLRKVEADRRRAVAFGLTKREIDIVRSVVAGYSNKEIAAQSAITENTVKSHLTHIFNKLGASNRVELALFAAHHRLIDSI